MERQSRVAMLPCRFRLSYVDKMSSILGDLIETDRSYGFIGL